MKTKWWLLISFVACLMVAAFSPLASTAPDGLERVAEDHGFSALAIASPFRIIADYAFPGIQNETIATMIAGMTGTVLVFAMIYGLMWLVHRKGQSA